MATVRGQPTAAVMLAAREGHAAPVILTFAIPTGACAASGSEGEREGRVVQHGCLTVCMSVCVCVLCVVVNVCVCVFVVFLL